MLIRVQDYSKKTNFWSPNYIEHYTKRSGVARVNSFKYTLSRGGSFNRTEKELSKITKQIF